ncbi:hypothetical protein BJ508DRAFT_374559 [Ascobolus immersus RN42]|uniref:Uncharacterized protein n=1 Tax=Ascobolus immersus RN42 TaxID=1160509 RepID=A0A3N4IIF0_ASCIM|nr:hypothetical protein BJ508DRAFT_374559 [Ascobolus immersus RN42]
MSPLRLTTTTQLLNLTFLPLLANSAVIPNYRSKSSATNGEIFRRYSTLAISGTTPIIGILGLGFAVAIAVVGVALALYFGAASLYSKSLGRKTQARKQQRGDSGTEAFKGLCDGNDAGEEDTFYKQDSKRNQTVEVPAELSPSFPKEFTPLPGSTRSEQIQGVRSYGSITAPSVSLTAGTKKDIPLTRPVAGSTHGEGRFEVRAMSDEVRPIPSPGDTEQEEGTDKDPRETTLLLPTTPTSKALSLAPAKSNEHHDSFQYSDYAPGESISIGWVSSCLGLLLYGVMFWYLFG